MQIKIQFNSIPVICISKAGSSRGGQEVPSLSHLFYYNNFIPAHPPLHPTTQPTLPENLDSQIVYF